LYGSNSFAPAITTTSGVSVSREVRDGAIGHYRGVSARDVEANADDGHLIVVRRDSTDRHDVAEVAVGHEGDAMRARGDVRQLREGLGVVRSENHGGE
jgi:uncharacterized membrane protein